MKILLLFTFMCVFFYGNTQVLNNRKIRKLEKFQIHAENLNLNEPRIQRDLNEIVFLDRKRKTNKFFGIFLGTFSVATMSLGTLGLINNSGGTEGEAVVSVAAGFVLAIGVIKGGFSFTIFKTAKRRKMERDNLTYVYNNNTIWVKNLPTGEVHLGRKGKVTACGINTKKRKSQWIPTNEAVTCQKYGCHRMEIKKEQK